MAQRDYVRKKNKPKNNSRIIPNLMMITAVILVVLFAAILYFVSTNKSNKPVSPPQNITEKPQATLPDKPQERWTYLKELENPNGSQSTSQQVGSPTATQEKERQQILDSFISEKPSTNQTVATSGKTSNEGGLNSTTSQQNQVNQSTIQNSQDGADKWLLQCGAFKDKANAELLKAKIAMLGFTSSIKSETFHRVLVGPYSSKLDADKAMATLKTNGVSSCISTTK